MAQHLDVPHGRGERWVGTLLIASLLGFWVMPAAAQLTITLVPSQPLEGGSVTLAVQGLAKDRLLCFSWFRGEGTEMAQQILTFCVVSGGLTLSPAYTGRETKFVVDVSHPSWNVYLPVFEKLAPPPITASTLAALELRDSVTLSCQSPSSDATFQWYTGKEPVVGSGQLELSLDQQRLTIHQVTRNDSGPYQYEVKNPAVTRLSEPLLLCVTFGVYTCEATNPASGSRGATGTLIIIPEYMPQPSILADSVAPVENTGSVTLMCVPPERVIAIRWFRNSDVFSGGGRGEPSPDHRLLSLRNITRNDTGLYQCEASSSATSSLSNPLPVNVNYCPDVPVINPMDATFVVGCNLTLSCFANSSPPAEYAWRADGSPGAAGQLPSILDITLHSSGLYSCHAVSADAGLQSMARLAVHIKDATSENDQGPAFCGPHIPGGGITDIVLGMVVGIALTATVAYFLGFMRDQVAVILFSLKEGWVPVYEGSLR
ncbi:carcinoembryonic antigen-related cell adhesion molecule 8-like [Eschrichtius robustus]|uniref:carcinoembryonic antigen-related cell adhesion molecule 8-like n=1 Tax=Eschrichtius robustus TaxID=9764 RepID=UPI0035C0586B